MPVSRPRAVVKRRHGRSRASQKPRPSFVGDVLPKEAASFFHLPRELQLHTFSFFTHRELCKTVAPVCQHWWRLSKDPSLWKSLHICLRKEDKTKALARLLLRSPMLNKLKIETNFYLEEFAVFAYACPMLKHLDLRNSEHVDHRILALFTENCPLLEVLNLNYCQKVDKKSVSSIVSLAHLRVLDMSRCVLLDNECIQLISEKCRYLEELNISGITGIADKSISNLIENLHSTLLRLEVSEGLTDLAFSKIGLCMKLQELFIYECYELTDRVLAYFKMLTSLKSFTFQYVSVTTIAINNFFAGPHVHNLVHLVLSECSIDDNGVYNVTQNCKLLKTFRLTGSNEFTEVGLEHIVKHCHNLVHLEMPYTSDNVTGLCLKLVPENLKCLEHLDVEGCDGIVESIILDLINRVPKLEVIW